MIILLYGTVTALCKLFLFLKHSSERPCEQGFFYVMACISEHIDTYYSHLRTPVARLKHCEKKGKKRTGLKGKIDRHENPSKVLLFSDGVYR